MTTMSPLGMSTRYIEAFNQRNGEAMWSMLDEDVVYIVGGNPPFSGPEAVKAFYVPAFEGDIVADTLSGIEQGGTVFVENRLSGTIPDGRAYFVEQAVRHQWRDGLLVEYRNYNDAPVVDGEPVTFLEFHKLLRGQED